MKKVVVMSDSHGYHEMIDEVRRREKADYYVHCGDIEGHEDVVKGWICVRGNNDWMANLPEQCIFQVEDVKFLVTHGHRFGYFDRLGAMMEQLDEYDCNVLLSGHTHTPMYEQIQDYSFINPGSVALPRGGSNKCYCVITVDGKNIDVVFKDI